VSGIENPFLEIARKARITAEAILSIKGGTSRIQRRMSRRMNDLQGEIMREVLAELNRKGYTPSSTAERRAITAIFQRVGGALMDRIFTEELEEAAILGRNQAISEMQKAGQSVVFDEFNRRTLERIRDHAFEASARTMSRMIGNVNDVLVHGYENGLGIDAIADHLRGEFTDMSESELERIARTEIHSQQEEGKFITEQEYGVEYHQWIAATDNRTREEVDGDSSHGHTEMNGQIVRVGEPFSNGLRYAGDRSGGEDTIGHWINCRCRIVPYIMPYGKRPPINKVHFYESDLEDIA
jgi:SPP1 gp7 family putative phage head morphogenesis protein